MKFPTTISYLEARNPTTGELVDSLYIGKCNYSINKFNLKYFVNTAITQYPISILYDERDTEKKTMVSSMEMEPYHIDKLKRAIQDFDTAIATPTMDETSALYDMKLVSEWMDAIPNHTYIYTVYRSME